MAKEYVESRQNGEFKEGLSQMSTRTELAKVLKADRVTLPEYLARDCPVGLRRTLKT